MSGREPILVALFNLLIGPAGFRTTGRRVKPLTSVSEYPALFLRHTGDNFAPRATRMPPIVTINCEAWIYSTAGADPSVAPDTALNHLLDAVETALRPGPAFDAQTLGGLVTHCWIEGQIDIHPGDLDGVAIAIVPISILCPNTL